MIVLVRINTFSKLISDIKKGEKLSDEHINAASQLLHGQFEDVQGLCSPVLGQKLLFPKFACASGYAGYAYFQILHTGSDHWIAISESEVYVYDSIFFATNILYIETDCFHSSCSIITDIITLGESTNAVKFCRLWGVCDSIFN